MELLISTDPNCGSDVYQLWDTVWNPASGSGDWALAGINDAANPMGLAANAALETMAVLCLFTDRQCPANHPLAQWAGADRRGYWGDAFLDEGEQPLGSLLWLLERAAALPGVERWAVSFAQDALAPLVPGVVAKVDVSAGFLPNGKGLWLLVKFYARTGQTVYARQFDLLWRQLAAGHYPTGAIGDFAIGVSAVG